MLDENVLRMIFEQMDATQRQKMLEVMGRVALAVKINKDEDFVQEAYEEYLYKDFPLLKQIIEEGKYRK